MSSVNVLAVMAAAASRMEASGAPRYAARVSSARAAVAELIEADKEYDAAKAAYSAAVGGRARFDLSDRVRQAHLRRAFALARCGGAQ